MDMTEFVDSSLRMPAGSEYAVSEDVLMDITDCLQNSKFYGDEGLPLKPV